MITDKQVEAALDYLRDSAEPASVARSQANVLEKYIGIIEAEQKALHKAASNASAQDLARVSPEYKQAVDAWGEALRLYAKHTMLREAALSKLEVWRTQRADARKEEKIGP